MRVCMYVCMHNCVKGIYEALKAVWKHRRETKMCDDKLPDGSRLPEVMTLKGPGQWPAVSPAQAAIVRAHLAAAA